MTSPTGALSTKRPAASGSMRRAANALQVLTSARSFQSADALPELSLPDLSWALLVGTVGFWLLLSLPILWPSPEATQVWLASAAVGIVGLLAIMALGFRAASVPLGRRLLAGGLVAIALGLFALPLALSWRHALNNGNVIGGLIPFSDAKAYVGGGWQLLAEGTLSTWNMRRPVNAALHALRLFLTSGDLMASLALMAWVIGLASLFACAQLRRDLGWAATTVFLISWFFFVDEWIPRALSEAHGCLLGVISFALFWRSASDRSTILYYLAMATLSLGLAARAGPFLMLPGLMVWGVLFLGNGWRDRVLVTVGGVAAMAAGQGVPRVFNALWGDASNFVYANFSHTLYGMVLGGKGWQQIKVDHPELFGGVLSGGAEQAGRIYELAFERFVHNPWAFPQFVSQELLRFPDFLKLRLLEPRDVQDLWFYLLAIGCIWMLVRWRERRSALLLLGGTGLWLSSPFLMQDGGARVFAAGVPWIFAGVGLGAHAIMVLATTLVGTRRADARAPRDDNGWLDRGSVAAVGVATFLVVLLGPIVAVALHPRMPAHSNLCPVGEVPLTIHGPSFATRLAVVPDSALRFSQVPVVRESDLFRGLRLDPKHMPMMKVVADHSPPYTLIHAYHVGRQNAFYALLTGDVSALPPAEVVAICARETCKGCRGGSLYQIRSWHPSGRE